MGDPRRLKKTYQGPNHPWMRSRIEEENVLVKEYGLKNKREIWKCASLAKSFTAQAKRLATATGAHALREKDQLFSRIKRLGLLTGELTLDDVLDLTAKAVLERRLQTVVAKRHLARSVKQARQFISHRHISVDGKIISSPGFLVPLASENSITFVDTSALSKDDHPERAVVTSTAPVKKDVLEGEKREAPLEANS